MGDESAAEWRPLALTGGTYEVSNFGAVRRTGRPEEPIGFDADRYRVATVLVDGKYQTFAVHRLMLLAFVGDLPSPRHRATFLDGNRSNFRLDNLAWLTPEECNQLRYIHGTYLQRPSLIINGLIHYQCCLCRRWQPEGEFYQLSPSFSRRGNVLSKCGRQSECRKCSTVRRRLSRREAKKNGGRVPTLLEKILPMLQQMDGLNPVDAGEFPAPGQRIAAMRKAKGMTQGELASAAGMNPQTIEVLERGKNRPSRKTLLKLAPVLCGITLNPHASTPSG